MKLETIDNWPTTKVYATRNNSRRVVRFHISDANWSVKSTMYTTVDIFDNDHIKTMAAAPKDDYATDARSPASTSTPVPVPNLQDLCVPSTCLRELMGEPHYHVFRNHYPYEEVELTERGQEILQNCKWNWAALKLLVFWRIGWLGAGIFADGLESRYTHYFSTHRL